MKRKKQDMSHFPIQDIRPAPENSLIYDGFTPNADEDDAKLYWSIKADGHPGTSAHISGQIYPFGP